MKALQKHSVIAILLIATACEHTGPLDDFMRPAPVAPIAKVIRASVPIGYCALLAMVDMRGYPVPCEKISGGSGFSILRISPGDEFPLVYLDESCREITVLCFAADNDFAVLSLFFTYRDPGTGRDSILEVHTIPVAVDEGLVRAVFASQDVYVRDSIELDLHMGPANVRIELDRVRMPDPETSEAAIRQNAWIIQVDPAGTWDLFEDDAYRITGGEQDVSVIAGGSGRGTSILQLALIEAELNPGCLMAPVEGYAVLHEIGVDTGPESSLEDLLMGSVFYRFDSPCSETVFVQAASGSFLTSTGKRVDLRLLE